MCALYFFFEYALFFRLYEVGYSLSTPVCSLPEIIIEISFHKLSAEEEKKSGCQVTFFLKRAFLYTGVFSMCILLYSTLYTSAYSTYICMPYIMWLLPKTTTFKNLYNIKKN